MELVFERFNKIIMSGQWGLAMGVYSELARTEYADRFEQSMSWEDHVLLVREAKANHFNGTPEHRLVGFVSWKPFEYRKDAFITMSWVDPLRRGNGIYQQMYDQVKAWALEDGCTTLSSGIYVKNRTMLHAAEKAGRKPVYTMFIETIKPVTPDKVVGVAEAVTA
jgi:GNAT superfamily N-acetyltransferase